MPNVRALFSFATRASAFCVVTVFATSAIAQNAYPTAQLNGVFPAGGKQGTAVEVTVSGVDLDNASALHFSHAGLTAAPKTVDPANTGKPKPAPRQFTVTIAANVPSGMYDLRVISKYGISNPRAFTVSTRTEVLEEDTNGKIDKPQAVPLESVVNGKSKADSSDFFKVPLKKGQRVLIDAAARRIDSKMSAAVKVFSPSGVELAGSTDTVRRDPLLDIVAADDGEHIIQIHDLLYRGGDDFVYRLAVHTGPHIDFVFPPAGVAGTKAEFTLYGRNLPGGVETKDLSSDGKPLQSLKVQIDLPSDPVIQRQLAISGVVEPQDSGLDAMQYRLASPQGESNPVNIGFATAPVVVEQEPNNEQAKAQKLTLPCEVAGQFGAKGDQDWFTFDAKKGDVYWIEAFSERLGLSTDPYLLVERVTKDDKGVEKVTELTALDDPKPVNRQQDGQRGNFDIGTEDPTYKFVAPDDGTYRVLIRDLYYGSRGAPQYVYRLAIRKETPDFRLVVVADAPADPNNNNTARLWSPLLHKGGAVCLRVYAFRQDDFKDEIELSVEGLPPGVKCPVAAMGTNDSTGVLVLTAEEAAAPWAGTLKVIGKAKINGQEVVREARGGNLVWGSANKQQDPPRARMAANIALAVSPVEVSPVAIEAGEGKVIETCLAGKLQIPVKVVRRGDFKGNLKLQASGVQGPMKPADLDIAAGAAEGKLNLDIKNGAQPGTYCFLLQSNAQINYRRDPAAADAAAEALKEAAKLAKEAADAAKAATDAQPAAVKALTDAQAAAKAATDKFNAAKTAADQKPGEQPLVDAKDAAEKEMQAAAEKVKAAETAKTAAEAAAKAATDKSKMLEAERVAADTKSKQATEAAKPKNINTVFVSTPITVKVASAPITLNPPTMSGPLKAGTKVEVPITISRQFGFADAVELSIQMPPGVSGLKVANVSIAKDQTEAKLVLEADAKMTTAELKLPLKAKLTYNGQALQAEQLLALKVEP